MDRNLINVLVLGLSFMLLFTSFQTGGLIQGAMVDAIKKENPSYTGDAFVSMCIIYFVLSVANWFAPSFVMFIGPRISMIASGVTYIFFIANFLWPQAWLLYLVSVVVGLGAAVIWTAQGNYLTLCSTKKTMSRNSGVFWALLQCSLLWGNIFVYFYFKDQKSIEKHTRMVTYTVLTVVGSLGIVTFFGLSQPSGQSQSNVVSSASDVLQSLKHSVKLLTTEKMALLCVTFWYTGLELGFFSVVYTTTIGRTQHLDPTGDPNKFIGLAGMIIGLGEITGGLLFGILGSKTVRWGRDPIVILGYLTHMVAFFLIFINFPKEAPIVSGATSQEAFINSSLAVALVCSFLLGFADSCYNTQCYSIVGTLWSENSAPAFALFKFFQSIACACALFYSNHANLYIQLAILAVCASIGTVTFVMVEWKCKRENEEKRLRAHQS